MPLSRTTTTKTTTTKPRKPPTPRVANDVSTVAGFLAEFEFQVERLRKANSWCYNGKERAYTEAGIDSPERRRRDGYTGMDPVLATPSEFLNEAGLARVAELQEGVLDKLRAGALAAAKFGVKSGYVGVAGVKTALAALGIPERPVTKRHYPSAFALRFSTSTRVESISSADLQQKMTDALLAVLAAEGITIQPSGNEPSLRLGTTSDQRVEWEVPASAAPAAAEEPAAQE